MTANSLYTESTAGAKRQTQPLRFVWLDLIKAIALIWIFLNHAVERVFGYPYIANPWSGWPPLSERLAQLHPLEGFGIWTIPANFLRYIGWSGDQGVTLFLIVSGFGLTWGLLARRAPSALPLAPFYRRRAERVYPLWWAVHLLFMATWILAGWGLSVTNPATYLSALGIRITPGLFYYFAPAWWYVGLLLQLYLIYPLLWKVLLRRGPLWFLIVSCIATFAARAVGLLWFDAYMDAWQRGALFITRLAEFAFGMSLAAWMHPAPDQVNRRLRRPASLLLALGIYLLGTILSLTLLGMTVAPFLLGVAGFVLLYALFRGKEPSSSQKARPWMWLGQHSYSLYLLHHPLILLLVPAGLAAAGCRSFAGATAAALLTIAGALALEPAVARSWATLKRWRGRLGIIRTIGYILVPLALLGMVLVGSELLIRRLAPQEVLGWGERPSLEPHATFGWRLKPFSETRLRWESYDYTVTANSLGFPGPEYPEPKRPGTLRIMTVGDAFTSAEGVDTSQAWPRLLESELASRLPNREVEVLNFAITGYGPNQYASVIEAYAPLYQPDLILIGFFVNEYQDVLQSDDEFRQSIGFDLPAQDGWYSIVRLDHLHHFVRLHILEPIFELLRGQPRPYGYFLGNFAAFQRDRADNLRAAQQLVIEQLSLVKKTADEVGAQIILAMIPASVQVCGADELAYYPKYVDLNDLSQFDPEQPQRLTQQVAEELGLGYYDLRPALQSGNVNCPYQEHNMHWTEAGHRAVADYLAEQLVSDSVVSQVGEK